MHVLTADNSSATAQNETQARSVDACVQPGPGRGNVPRVLLASMQAKKNEQEQAVIHRRGRIIRNSGIECSSWRRPWNRRTRCHTSQEDMVPESLTADPEDDVDGLLVPPPTPISLLTGVRS